jgi:hypothetical protein
MNQRIVLAVEYVQFYNQVKQLGMSAAQIRQAAKGLAEYRVADKELQSQFERYVNLNEKQRQAVRISVKRDNPNFKRIGTQSVLNGKPVVWAGEEWGWQSPATYLKLQNSGFTKPQATKPQATKPKAPVAAPPMGQPEMPEGFMPQVPVIDSGMWVQMGIPAPYPIDDFTPAQGLAGDIRDTNLENVAAQQELNAENIGLAIAQAKSDLEKLATDLSRAQLDIKRGLEDSKLSINQLIQSSKGYLTAWEEIQRAGQEVEQQYRSQRRSLEDQIFNLQQSVKASDEFVTRTEKELALQEEKLATDKSMSQVERERLNGSMAISRELLAKGKEMVETNKERLNTAIDEYGELQKSLNANEAIAKASAENLKNQELTLSALKSYADMAGNLSSARYKLGGSLIDESPVLRAQVGIITAPIEAAEDAKRMKLTAEQTASYVALAKETAAINLKQSYVEAIPFIQEFSSGLKDVVLMTENWQSALKKLLDLMASTILDQLVIKPLIGTISNWIGPMLGLGGLNGNTIQAPQTGQQTLSPFVSVLGNLAGATIGAFTGGMAPLPAINKFDGGMVEEPVQNLAMGGPVKDLVQNLAMGGMATEIGLNAIVALKREKAMGGGKPVLAALTAGEYVVPRNKVPEYLAFERDRQMGGLLAEAKQIRNFATGGMVGTVSTVNKPTYGGRSVVVNNNTTVKVESRNDMGYTLSQLERRNNLQTRRAERLS